MFKKNKEKKRSYGLPSHSVHNGCERMVILKGSDSPAMYYSSTIPWMRLKKRPGKEKTSCLV